MQIPVHNINGEVIDNIEIREDVFNVPLNQAVMHQAMVRQLANSRQGTANTKTRAEVRGSGRKIFRQKHTGFARAGRRRSPIRRGGGVAFGPHTRSYKQAMPKKMHRLAIKCALSTKTGSGEIKVLDRIELDEPRTKEMVKILRALGISISALIVTAEPEINVIKSSRNIPGTKTLPASLLNVVDLLSYRMLVITVAAVHRVEELWAPKQLTIKRNN